MSAEWKADYSTPEAAAAKRWRRCPWPLAHARAAIEAMQPKAEADLSKLMEPVRATQEQQGRG
jgi:hypothetical protein